MEIEAGLVNVADEQGVPDAEGLAVAEGVAEGVPEGVAEGDTVALGVGEGPPGTINCWVLRTDVVPLKPATTLNRVLEEPAKAAISVADSRSQDIRRLSSRR